MPVIHYYLVFWKRKKCTCKSFANPYLHNFIMKLWWWVEWKNEIAIAKLGVQKKEKNLAQILFYSTFVIRLTCGWSPAIFKLINLISSLSYPYDTFLWSFAHIHPFSCMVLVDKLFGRLSSFIFQLKCSSIIFKFDLSLKCRKESLFTWSVILSTSQSIDNMWSKWKGCLPP